MTTLAQYLAGGAAARPDSLTGLNPAFTDALTAMFTGAPPEIQAALRISSAYRSPELQAKLYEDAVAKYGSPEAARKWVAPPGRSQHNHGMAVDLRYLNPTAQEWVHANADNYGLTFPMSHEPWHVELAGARSGAQPGPVANAFTNTMGSAAPAGMGQTPLSFGPIGNGPAAPVLGQVAGDWMNQQREKMATRQQEDQARRAALFGAGQPGGLASMFG